MSVISQKDTIDRLILRYQLSACQLGGYTPRRIYDTQIPSMRYVGTIVDESRICALDANGIPFWIHFGKNVSVYPIRAQDYLAMNTVTDIAAAIGRRARPERKKNTRMYRLVDI